MSDFFVCFEGSRESNHFVINLRFLLVLQYSSNFLLFIIYLLLLLLLLFLLLLLLLLVIELITGSCIFYSDDMCTGVS